MDVDWGQGREWVETGVEVPPLERLDVDPLPGITVPATLTVPTAARNASLDDVVNMLTVQHDLKYDVVVPSQSLSYEDGVLVIKDGAAQVDDEGVMLRDAHLLPTHSFDGAIADKLKIPRMYMRHLRNLSGSNPVLRLLDSNVNTWLDEKKKNWFVRGYRTDDPNQVGVARAFLSDSYQVIDNLDVLMTTLDALNGSGVNARVHSANLTETMMDVKIHAPEVQAHASKFLETYQNPFSGRTGEHGAGSDVVFAGFSLRNSETGGGAFALMPQVIIEICVNGYSITQDLMRKVHIGSVMEQGVVRWSEHTRTTAIELVHSQVTDATRTFMSQEYIDNQAAHLESLAGVVLDRPVEALRQVTTQFKYSEEEQASILELFARGGDHRASGVGQAVTAYAQGDAVPAARAQAIEDEAFKLVRVAAGLSG